MVGSKSIRSWWVVTAIWSNADCSASQDFWKSLKMSITMSRRWADRFELV